MLFLSDRRRASFRDLGALSLHSFRDGDAHIVALAGELDLGAVEEVERELRRVEATPARVVVLDLRELQFIDSSGVRVIVMAHRRADSRLVVVKGGKEVQRVLEICGIDKLLSFVDRIPVLAAAVRELRPSDRVR